MVSFLECVKFCSELFSDDLLLYVHVNGMKLMPVSLVLLWSVQPRKKVLACTCTSETARQYLANFVNQWYHTRQKFCWSLMEATYKMKFLQDPYTNLNQILSNLSCKCPKHNPYAHDFVSESRMQNCTALDISNLFQSFIDIP